MWDQTSNTKITLGSERSFGIVFGVVFGLLALFLLYKGFGAGWIVAALSAGVFAAGFWKPAILHRPNKLWFKFGLWLHAIVSPITMFFVFVLAFVPTGLFVKLRGYDPLSREFDPALQSYWKPREKRPESMKRQY